MFLNVNFDHQRVLYKTPIFCSVLIIFIIFSTGTLDYCISIPKSNITVWFSVCKKFSTVWIIFILSPSPLALHWVLRFLISLFQNWVSLHTSGQDYPLLFMESEGRVQGSKHLVRWIYLTHSKYIFMVWAKGFLPLSLMAFLFLCMGRTQYLQMRHQLKKNWAKVPESQHPVSLS